MVKAEDRLGITCPKTSKFYVCPGKPSRFLGCCSVNPCDTSDGSCPQESLEYTSFNKSAYADIPAQGCVNQESGNAWYTCAGSQPPFMGCCNVNPCSAFGCPAESLRASALSNVKKEAAVFLGEAPASVSSSLTSTATPSSTTSDSSPVTSASKADHDVQDHTVPSKVAIAGISVGATIVAVVLLSIIIVWLRKRFEVKRRQQQRRHDPSTEYEGSSSSYQFQHNNSPDPQHAKSPGISPGSMNVSPYTGYQPSPPQQWDSYRPLPTQYDAQNQYDGAREMMAELAAPASEGTRKAYDEKMGLKMGGNGPIELGSDRSTGQLVPVELEDSTTYDREPK